MSHRNYDAEHRYTGRYGPPRPTERYYPPIVGAPPRPAGRATTGRPVLASVALALGVLGCIFVAPAPLAMITGWLAMHGRGGPGTDTFRIARLAFILGLTVTIAASAALLAGATGLVTGI